ncbi:MAG: hypothetical protein H7Z75_15630 [Ferruginibacter sp.]|nr:hypothetical protein [Cytophagales bacterium]
MKPAFFFGLCLLLAGLPSPFPSQLLPTRLEITVRNELGNLEAGASVQLFKTQQDYDKGENPVTEVKKTDAKGRTVFSDLEAIEYYVQAEKGDLDNQDAGVKTIKLVTKRTNKVTIIIS